MASAQDGGFLPRENPLRFIPYRCGPLRGFCVGGYETLDLGAIPWDRLKDRPDPDHALAKSSRTRRVVRFEFTQAGGQPCAVYAKRVLIRGWRKRLGSLFQPSKACREWVAGHRLLAMGLATARPVLYAEQRRGLWLQANYLVTEEIAGAQPVRQELEREGGPEQRRDLLCQLARWLCKVHRHGFYHDDCSTQHVFVGPGAGDLPRDERQFWLIDLDNCRFHRGTVPWRRRVKNLFQLLRSVPAPWLSRTDRLRLIQVYLETSGEPHRLGRAVAGMRRLARAKEADVRL